MGGEYDDMFWFGVKIVIGGAIVIVAAIAAICLAIGKYLL